PNGVRSRRRVVPLRQVSRGDLQRLAAADRLLTAVSGIRDHRRCARTDPCDSVGWRFEWKIDTAERCPGYPGDRLLLKGRCRPAYGEEERVAPNRTGRPVWHATGGLYGDLRWAGDE